VPVAAGQTLGRPIWSLCEFVRIRSLRAHTCDRSCAGSVNTAYVCSHLPTNCKSLRGWRSQERESSNLSFRTNLEWRGPLHPAKLTPLRSLFAARSAPFASFYFNDLLQSSHSARRKGLKWACCANGVRNRHRWCHLEHVKASGWFPCSSRFDLLHRVNTDVIPI
jgi:hypothetical protein